MTTGTARRSPMSQYAQEAAEAFAQARACYEETEQWLGSAEVAALTHAELEDQLGVRGESCCGGCSRGRWSSGRCASSAAMTSPERTASRGPG